MSQSLSTSLRKPTNSRRCFSSSASRADTEILSNVVDAIAETDDPVVLFDRRVLGLDHTTDGTDDIGRILRRLQAALLRCEGQNPAPDRRSP